MLLYELFHIIIGMLGKVFFRRILPGTAAYRKPDRPLFSDIQQIPKLLTFMLCRIPYALNLKEEMQ